MCRLIMSPSVFNKCVCVLLFLVLAVKVDSQGIRFPFPNEDFGTRGSSDCNCITVRRCPAIRNRPDWRTAGETCGYGNGQYRRVCCPRISGQPPRPKPPVVPQPGPEPPVVPQPGPEPPVAPQPRPGPPIGPPSEVSVCGVSNYTENPFKPLIMGGENATEGQWPWMVAIRIRESTGYYAPWCSGFLIDRKHVISAAHCYHTRSDDRYRARIGSINQDIADEYRITRIAVPAGYKNKQFYDDIAVLTLDREVRFPNFNPVCLPNEEISRMNLENKGTTVSGWGADKDRGEMKSYLQYLARLPVMSNQMCQRALRDQLKDSFQRQFPRGINRGFICAAFKEGNKDACGGDSGGPQMLQSGNRWYAVGIVSFGFKCGIPGMPGGYTRVANYIDWIKQNTVD